MERLPTCVLQAESSPKPGDLIEIFRPLYSHWAIYVGNGYVVHLVATGESPVPVPCSMSSALKDKAIVKRELLSKVAGTDNYRVNNKNDDKHDPKPVKEIVQRAEEMVGKERSYSMTSYNCEHFVNELRYGVPRSDQVEWLHDVGVPKFLENLGIVEGSLSKEDAKKQ